MPWNETTKTEYTRPRDRFESDLTDEEWNLKPCLPPPAKRGRPRKKPSGGVRSSLCLHFLIVFRHDGPVLFLSNQTG